MSTTTATHDTGADRVVVEPPTALLVTPPQAAAMLAISRTTLYFLARDGDLTAIRIGRSTRFAVAELEAYVTRRLATTPPPTADR